MKFVTKFIIVCFLSLVCFVNLSSAMPTEKEKPQAFTIECAKAVESGFYGITRLVLELGEETSCTLLLNDPSAIGLKTHGGNKLSTNLRAIESKVVIVSPEHGETDGNGKFHFTISTKGVGDEWIAWAVPDAKGEFVFTKDTIKQGIAHGMFVKVEK